MVSWCPSSDASCRFVYVSSCASRCKQALSQCWYHPATLFALSQIPTCSEKAPVQLPSSHTSDHPKAQVLTDLSLNLITSDSDRCRMPNCKTVFQTPTVSERKVFTSVLCLPEYGAVLERAWNDTQLPHSSARCSLHESLLPLQVSQRHCTCEI